VTEQDKPNQTNVEELDQTPPRMNSARLQKIVLATQAASLLSTVVMGVVVLSTINHSFNYRSEVMNNYFDNLNQMQADYLKTYFDRMNRPISFSQVSNDIDIDVDTGDNPDCKREDIIYRDNVYFAEPGMLVRKHGGYYDNSHPLADNVGCVHNFQVLGTANVS
jgi:hypothetical protein